ncbi:MAG: dTDP-4-dehydrorhamnose 3,5-epimerase [bacterium]
MEIITTDIQGILIIKPTVFKDTRGYFYESYSKNKFAENSLDLDFVQDNISKSSKGTIRGLHYQTGKFAQGKLCQVIYGKVLDVAVDIRFGSPTFGKYVSVELSDENKNQIWIPAGFAHGFEVLSDEAIFHYKCTNFYNRQSERSIIFNDNQLNIKWKTNLPVVSDKDLLAGSFNKINEDFIYKNLIGG